VKKKVLFIDDDPTILMISEIIINNLGYDALMAEGGKAALDILANFKASPVDIILLDLMMPDIYGTEVLEYIKNSEILKNIPVIIQTGINDNAEVNKALKMGANEVLYKPYDKEQLKNALDKFSVAPLHESSSGSLRIISGSIGGQKKEPFQRPRIIPAKAGIQNQTTGSLYLRAK
jgi:CheY-like chemotaxis protein